MLGRLMDELQAAEGKAHDELMNMRELVPQLNRFVPRAETQFWQTLNAPVRFVKQLSIQAKMVVAADICPDKEVLARFWEGRVRAVVSSDYTCLPHSVFVDAIARIGGLEVKSYWPTSFNEYTGSLHIRAVIPRVEWLVGPDDRTQLMAHLVNSEVGTSAMWLRVGLFRLICTNGLFAFESIATMLRERHIYRQPEEMVATLEEALADAPDVAGRLVERLREAREIAVQPQQAERYLQSYGYPRFLIDSTVTGLRVQHPTLWDFFMALTAAAQQYENFESQVAVERRATEALYDTRWIAGHEHDPDMERCPTCGSEVAV